MVSPARQGSASIFSVSLVKISGAVMLRCLHGKSEDLCLRPVEVMGATS
jgi:hypothetical protein